jgi:hypothetical protein
MALSELERRKTDQALLKYQAGKRPPPEMRDKLDISYRISDQSVLIYMIRPRFLDPSQSAEEPIAKATFVRTAEVWKVYWMRADSRWHSYQPLPEVPSIAAFLRVVEEDAFGCFWG